MTRVSYDWTPKDFKNVVAKVTSAQGESLSAMTKQLEHRGFLSCPPPAWDPEGVYRVALSRGRPEIQRLDDAEAWAASKLTPMQHGREKHQKFRILDAPQLLNADLQKLSGPFGIALLYLDIDGFKQFNTRHTERVVDRTLLPDFQRLVEGLAKGHGYTYAEGGDEVILLLRNANETMSLAFADSLRREVEAHPFAIELTRVQLTVSVGLACTAEGFHPHELPELANRAKAHAKKSGKNVVCVMKRDGVPKALRVRTEAPAGGPGGPWRGMFIGKRGE
jgi:diguanylate cyclase (GGDEF)-like protein